jgi:hypothetical protein
MYPVGIGGMAEGAITAKKSVELIQMCIIVNVHHCCDLWFAFGSSLFSGNCTSTGRRTDQFNLKRFWTGSMWMCQKRPNHQIESATESAPGLGKNIMSKIGPGGIGSHCYRELREIVKCLKFIRRTCFVALMYDKHMEICYVAYHQWRCACLVDNRSSSFTVTIPPK